MKEIESEILKIVCKIADNNKITEKSLLLDEGWIDSLSAVFLLDELESKFSIEIDMEELTHENFNTIQNISQLITKQIEK